MTETEQVNDKTNDEMHRSYILQVSFWRPDGGPLRVIAKDEEHARELLPKILSHVRDIEIHSVVAESNIEHSEAPPTDEEPSEVPPTSKMVN